MFSRNHAPRRTPIDCSRPQLPALRYLVELDAEALGANTRLSGGFRCASPHSRVPASPSAQEELYVYSASSFP